MNRRFLLWASVGVLFTFLAVLLPKFSKQLSAGQELVIAFGLAAILIAAGMLRATGRFPSRGELAERRRQKGQCAHCGYDLRGSPERCPECGTSRIE